MIFVARCNMKNSTTGEINVVGNGLDHSASRQLLSALRNGQDRSLLMSKAHPYSIRNMPYRNRRVLPADDRNLIITAVKQTQTLVYIADADAHAGGAELLL